MDDGGFVGREEVGWEAMQVRPMDGRKGCRAYAGCSLLQDIDADAFG